VPEYLPALIPGDAITVTAGVGGVTGGLMATVGGTIAGANAVDWLGVASRDAAQGVAVGVYAEAVQRVQGAGALAQGTLVKCAAAGQVTTWVSGTDAPDRLVGILLEAISGAGVAGKCKFIR
jgi:Uncharacterized conserved protein (DUF2190)